MLKEGHFAIYKGKEYELITCVENGQRVHSLRSKDSGDIRLGFEAGPYGYYKKVQLSELESAYSVYPKCIFHGCELGIFVEDEKEKKILITGGYEQYVKLSKYDFETLERGVYGKWVGIDEVERLYEEKSPLLGFPLPR